MHAVINVGHTRKSQGASNKQSGLTEYEYNRIVAQLVANYYELNKDSGIKVTVVYQDGIRYSMLAHAINELNPDFVLSLHCNAFDENTRGAEALYYAGSEKGEIGASRLLDLIQDVAICRKFRGIKGLREGDRGYSLLRGTKAPCVIAEPFFIDNDIDCMQGRREVLKLADVYADLIWYMCRYVTKN